VDDEFSGKFYGIFVISANSFKMNIFVYLANFGNIKFWAKFCPAEILGRNDIK